MIPFFRQYKEYLVPLFFAASGVALVWFGIIPLQQGIVSQMDRSQELLADRDIANASVANLESLRLKRDEVVSHKDQLGMVVAKRDIVDLIKVIEGLAKDTGNDISIDAREQPPVAAAPKSSAKKDDSKNEVDTSLVGNLPSDHWVKIAITLTGEYRNTMKFLQKIETMPFQADVTGVNITVHRPDVLPVRSGNIFLSEPLTPDAQPVSTVALDPQKLPVEMVLDVFVYVNED